MKQITGHMIELAAAGLIVLFCMGILLYRSPGVGSGGVMEAAAQLLQAKEEHMIVTKNEEKLRGILSSPCPEITYCGGVLKVGDIISLRSCFSVTVRGEAKDSELRLKALYNEAGHDILANAELNGDETGSELTGELSYSPESQELRFHQGGIYRARIQATGPLGRTTIKELEIPVELDWEGI